MLLRKQANTLCIRCGKLRIFSRKWQDRENGRGTLISHEHTVCPDEECQKLVDEKFQEMRDRRELSLNKKKGVVLTKSPSPQLFKASK